MECCLTSCLALPIIAVLVYFYYKKDPEPLFKIYRQQGKWFWLKYIVFYCILKLRKWKLTSNTQSPGYGRKSFDSIEEMEQVQPLSAHPKALDAVFFTGASSEGHYCVVAYARRPKQVVNGFVFLLIPEIGLLQSPRVPDTLVKADGDSSYTGEGINIQMIRPMRHWKVSYKGKMKFANDPEKEVDVNFFLDFESQLRHFDFNTDVSPCAMASAIAKEPWSKTFFDNLRETHQNHYEQMGILTGFADVEGFGNYKLRLSHGFRDHSYSYKREWKQLHRYVVHNVTVEDGTRFMVGIISLPLSFSVFECGYLYKPNGQLVGVDWCDLPICYMGEGGNAPKQYGFTFGAGGKTYQVQVDVVDEAEIFIGHKWEARILERMCRYTVNGLKGWGLLEWEYRHKGERPAKYSL